MNIGSVSAERPAPTVAAYGAAKAALANYTRTTGQEWLPKVRVNLVTVGMVRTELAHLHYGDEEGVRRTGAQIPIGRLAQPTEIAPNGPPIWKQAVTMAASATENPPPSFTSVGNQPLNR